MIQFANQEEHDSYKKQQRARIYDSYLQSGRQEAAPISKAALDEQYPPEKWERYTLQAIHKFRTDLIKADGVEDKDAAFKEAVKNLKSFIVHNEGKKSIVFVREKETGE